MVVLGNGLRELSLVVCLSLQCSSFFRVRGVSSSRDDESFSSRKGLLHTQIRVSETERDEEDESSDADTSGTEQLLQVSIGVDHCASFWRSNGVVEDERKWCSVGIVGDGRVGDAKTDHLFGQFSRHLVEPDARGDGITDGTSDRVANVRARPDSLVYSRGEVERSDNGDTLVLNGRLDESHAWV